VLEEISEKSTKGLHCFRKTDFQRPNFYISEFDLSDLYSSQNMDDAINIFYRTVNSFFNSCIPLYTTEIRGQDFIENSKIPDLNLFILDT